MAVTVRRTEFDNFEALQNIMQDGHSEVVPVGNGRLTGALNHVEVTPTFGMSNGAFSRGVRLRGITSAHRWMIGMVLNTNGPATVQQQEMMAGDLLMVAPGQERYSIYRGETDFAAMLVTPDELQAHLASERAALDLQVWRQPVSVLRTDRVTAAENIRQLSMLSKAMADDSLPEQTADFYRRNMLELLTSAATKGLPYHGPLRPAIRLVRDVDQYLTEAGNRPIHVSELCEQFNVPRRTLFHAFEAVLGMPPISFLRHKRLAHVHTALLRAGPGALVRAIAVAHGFLDQSHFIGQYRRLFGELPSQTIRRAACSLHVVWIATLVGFGAVTDQASLLQML